MSEWWLAGENWRTQRRAYFSAALSTVNLTWSHPGLNSCLCSEKPVSSRLRYGIIENIVKSTENVLVLSFSNFWQKIIVAVSYPHIISVLVSTAHIGCQPDIHHALLRIWQFFPFLIRQRSRLHLVLQIFVIHFNFVSINSVHISIKSFLACCSFVPVMKSFSSEQKKITFFFIYLSSQQKKKSIIFVFTKDGNFTVYKLRPYWRLGEQNERMLALELFLGIRLVSNMPQYAFIQDFISISMEAGNSKLLTYTKIEDDCFYWCDYFLFFFIMFKIVMENKNFYQSITKK
jgi:hypothetical protein